MKKQKRFRIGVEVEVDDKSQQLWTIRRSKTLSGAVRKCCQDFPHKVTKIVYAYEI